MRMQVQYQMKNNADMRPMLHNQTLAINFSLQVANGRNRSSNGGGYPAASVATAGNGSKSLFAPVNVIVVPSMKQRLLIVCIDFSSLLVGICPGTPCLPMEGDVQGQTPLGTPCVLDRLLCCAFLWAVPERGGYVARSVLTSPKTTPQERGVAHGPLHPAGVIATLPGFLPRNRVIFLFLCLMFCLNVPFRSWPHDARFVFFLSLYPPASSSVLCAIVCFSFRLGRLAVLLVC